MLALLKAFGFSFNNLKIESTFDEFVRIIGKYWILAAIFGRNIIFEPCNNNIKVAYYREIRQGIGDWLQSDPIYNCIDGDQILDFDISNWDAEATVPSLIPGTIVSMGTKTSGLSTKAWLNVELVCPCWPTVIMC